MRLREELRALGCGLGDHEFTEKISQIFRSLHPYLSVEEVLCRWPDSAYFCAMVRYQVKLPDYADELILRTLLNTRKKGKLSTRDQVIKQEKPESPGSLEITGL